MNPETIALEPLAVPLRPDADGVLRVGDSRIPLDRVVECHKQGQSPEAIVEAFDTLQLEDVYAVLAWYLGHKAEVESYLQRREAEAAEVRRRIESAQPARPGFWEELKARQAKAEAERAQAGQ